jgi:hypothetical protein
VSEPLPELTPLIQQVHQDLSDALLTLPPPAARADAPTNTFTGSATMAEGFECGLTTSL